MADVTIYGSPNSTFVRSTLMACKEKAVAYDNVAVGGDGEDMKGAAHLARHPFGRIPAMKHRDVTLFESMAIAQYIDDVFESGVKLQPVNVVERARMIQWASAILDYITPDTNREFTLQFVFPSGPGGKPDMARIDAARPRIRSHCEIIDKALEGRTYLAGYDNPSIADLLLAPPLFYVGNMPAGMSSFEGLDNLGRWWEAVSSRASFKDTLPPIIDEMAKAKSA